MKMNSRRGTSQTAYKSPVVRCVNVSMNGILCNSPSQDPLQETETDDGGTML